METVELACEKREVRPKGLINRIRREGRVPGVLYGNTGAATAIAVPEHELNTRVRSAASQRLIRLKSGATELDGKHVILKQVQRTPVKGNILHFDFYEVDLNKSLRVAVPLRFVGRAAGAVDGGILQPLEREVLVECLPLEIPESIEVDISPLGIHEVLHVSSIKFASNVRPIFDTDYPVVTVLPPTVAEAPVAAAAEAVPVEGAPAEGAPAAAAAGQPAAAEGAAAKPAAAPAGGAKKA
ncbi:MAG TPA: 50S ribosomal protein L25 [Candidatus Binataceae bacterium]|nr:50S ribosomal protein L25 [Candidatus Binataceae bacterium]